jgi:hypothetical protein
MGSLRRPEYDNHFDVFHSDLRNMMNCDSIPILLR